MSIMRKFSFSSPPMVRIEASLATPSISKQPLPEKPAENFLYRLYGPDGGSRLHFKNEFHSVEMPAEFGSIPLAEGYSFQSIYAWNVDSYSNDKVYQIVLAKDQQPVAQLTFKYYSYDVLVIVRMETLLSHRRQGLSKALLKSAEILIGHKAREVDFSVDYTNEETFMKSFEAGASVEVAIAGTPIGKYLAASRYTLSKFAPSQKMKEMRPDLANMAVPEFHERVRHPYFWYTREP